MMSPSSFPVRRFSSPRQFQTIRFMSLGRAGYQPSPMKKNNTSSSLKTHFFLQGNSEGSPICEKALFSALMLSMLPTPLFSAFSCLMICFIFYLNCLNDKEKGLKLSIYKKKNTISFKLGNLDTHLF